MIIATVIALEEVGTKDWVTAFKAEMNEDGDIVNEDRAVEWALKREIEEEISSFDGFGESDFTVSTPDPYDRRVFRSFLVTVTPVALST
jgi:hypothetical protein